MPIIEIMNYTLRRSCSDHFHAIMKDISVPLHRMHGIDVVAFGHSEGLASNYVLIRSFPSLVERESQLSDFYQSAGWRNGPRAEIIAAIEAAVPVILTVKSTVIDGLRNHEDRSA